MTELAQNALHGVTAIQMQLLTADMDEFFDAKTKKLFSNISQLTIESDCDNIDHVAEQLSPFSDSQLLKAAEKFKSDAPEFLLVRRLWEHRLKKRGAVGAGADEAAVQGSGAPQ